MNLAFTVQQFDDNSKITVTDTTTDWAAGEIIDVFYNGIASLTITILGIEYDPIDITSWFNGGIQSELIFLVLPEYLKIDGVVQFGNTVPDGDWEIEYNAAHTLGGSNGGVDQFTDTDFLTGVATKAVNDQVQVTNLNDFKFENTVHAAMITGTWVVYLRAIEQAKAEENVTDFRHGIENLNIMIANKTY